MNSIARKSPLSSVIAPRVPNAVRARAASSAAVDGFDARAKRSLPVRLSVAPSSTGVSDNLPLGDPAPVGDVETTPPAPGKWTTQTAPVNASTMMLLTDGRLMVQSENAPEWWLLTPNSKGSYEDGTW